MYYVPDETKKCGYYECEAGGSYAGGYDRPEARVFLRISHYQKQLDLHSPGRYGASGRNLPVDR